MGVSRGQELPLGVLAADVPEEPPGDRDRALGLRGRGHRGFVGCSRLLPGAQIPPGYSCSLPTHGSGSRLFTKATKLCGISPSWPVVSDCAFHHSPFLQRGHRPVRPALSPPGPPGALGHRWHSLTLPGHAASPPSSAPGPRRAWAHSCTGPPPACLRGQTEGQGWQ